MQNPTFRTVVVVVLLLTGLLVVYGPAWFGPASGPAETGLTYVADLDFWQRTGREQLVQTTVPLDLSHDLHAVPLQVGDWQGEEVPERNAEVFMLLEPEQFVRRRYRDGAGHHLWLTLIGGRQSRSFHPVDLCYDADGWQATLSSRAIPLHGDAGATGATGDAGVTRGEGGELYGLWLEARKQFDGDSVATEHLVFYFYLFPNRTRDQTDGIVLFKLATPRYGSITETVAIQSDFLSHLFSQAIPVSETW